MEIVIAFIAAGLGALIWQRRRRPAPLAAPAFDTDAEVALAVARHEANQRDQPLGPLHLLYGLLQAEPIVAAVAQLGGDADSLVDRVLQALDGAGDDPHGEQLIAYVAAVARAHRRPASCADLWSVMTVRAGASPIESPGFAGARSDAKRRGDLIESPGFAGARSGAKRRGDLIESPGFAGARSGAKRRGDLIESPDPIDGGAVTMASVLFVLAHGTRELPAPEPAGLVEVVLHNDDFTRMEVVVAILREIFELDDSLATTLMQQAHHAGSATIGRLPGSIAAPRIAAAHARARADGYPLWIEAR